MDAGLDQHPSPPFPRAFVSTALIRDSSYLTCLRPPSIVLLPPSHPPSAYSPSGRLQHGLLQTFARSSLITLVHTHIPLTRLECSPRTPAVVTPCHRYLPTFSTLSVRVYSLSRPDRPTCHCRCYYTSIVSFAINPNKSSGRINSSSTSRLTSFAFTNVKIESFNDQKTYNQRCSLRDGLGH